VSAQSRPGIWRRFLLPVGIVVGLWLVTDVVLTSVVRQPFPFAESRFYKPVMNLLARTRILSLLGGGLLIYPILYWQGARLGERLLGTVSLPLTYMVTAILRATAFFPLPEAVYYGFNIITLGGFFLQFVTASVADLLCRLWERRHGGSRPLLRPAHIAGILVGLVAGFVLLVWNGGATGFYLYQRGYELLFQ